MDVLSHSCAAGTWLIVCPATLTTAGPSNTFLRIHDGTASVAELEYSNQNNSSYVDTMTVVGVVTLSGTATVKLQAMQNYHGNGVSNVYDGASNKNTSMFGVKIA